MADIEKVTVNENVPDIKEEIPTTKPEPKVLTLEEATKKLEIYDNNFKEIAKFINNVLPRIAQFEEQQANIIEFLAQDKKDTVKERLLSKAKAPIK